MLISILCFSVGTVQQLMMVANCDGSSDQRKGQCRISSWRKVDDEKNHGGSSSAINSYKTEIFGWNYQLGASICFVSMQFFPAQVTLIHFMMKFHVAHTLSALVQCTIRSGQGYHSGNVKMLKRVASKNECHKELHESKNGALPRLFPIDNGSFWMVCRFHDFWRKTHWWRFFFF